MIDIGKSYCKYAARKNMCVYIYIYMYVFMYLKLYIYTIYLICRFDHPLFESIQFSSVAQSCPTLCKPMDCSTSGLPVHHQLLEFTQTHVH